MPNSELNHISIHAKDVEESRKFYEELFGVEVLPMPNMGAPGYWLKLGKIQLHLYGTVRPGDGDPLIETVPYYQHFAVTVDDFVEFYRLAREREVPEEGNAMWTHSLNILPNGMGQYYVRDPSGNLIEIDFQDAGSLPEDILKNAVDQTIRLKQTAEQAKAGLLIGDDGA